ncbi:MAG: hypothetical protein AAGH79_09000 [Bacteroidota bacterium]
MSKGQLFQALSQTVDRLSRKTSLIGPYRIQRLEQAAQRITDHFTPEQTLHFAVVCTHNARRSQMGQAWLQALATYHDLPNIQAFSAGTETSAFHPNAVKALISLGFQIEGTTDTRNPMYHTLFGEALAGFTQYSKTIFDARLPQENLVAIMVCRSAEEACPLIPGAPLRLSIPFTDPGKADQTPEAPAAYLATAEEIGLTFHYLFVEIKKAWNKKAQRKG